MESTYKKGYFKAFIFLLVFVIILPVFASIEFPKAKKTYAKNDDVLFDETNIMDDLQSMTFDGVPFNIGNFPKGDSRSELKFLAFVEYCYSFYENGNPNYGIYLYVYNPAQIEFSENIGQNKIQIANRFDNKGNPTDWKRHPADYSKFNLEFISKSEGNNLRLFYKFKVIDNEFALFENIRNYEKTHSGIRRYYVSGIELKSVNSYTAIDYKVATMFEYSGYAEGYGPASDIYPLKIKSEPLEVAELDVHNVTFRTSVSNLEKGHHNQLDSVYFGVDNRYFEQYGNLQKIKAEWWEYKTKPIVVTKDRDFYDFVKERLGVPTTSSDSTKFVYLNPVPELGTVKRADWAWGFAPSYGYYNSLNCVQSLYYCFYVNDIKRDNPSMGSTLTEGSVSSETLYNFIKSESLKHGNYLPDIKEGTKISSYLFESYVDNNRKRGYNVHDFELGNVADIKQLLSYQDSNPSFWNKWANYGLFKAIFGGGKENWDDGYYDVEPIYFVEDKDLQGTDAEVARRLLVPVSELKDFKAYYESQKKLNKKTVLFRFALTDYFSDWLELHELYEWTSIDEAYMAQETCFFDFDIIQLTFNDKGVETIIPCVSNPIDIIGAITPPTTDNSSSDWLLWLLLIIILLVLLLILSPLLPSIVNGAVAIVKLPFKAGSAVVNSFKKDKHTKQQRQYSKSSKRKYNRKKR